MEVYKFGGASINSIDRIKNTANIIKEENEKKLCVITAFCVARTATKTDLFGFSGNWRLHFFAPFFAVRQK